MGRNVIRRIRWGNVALAAAGMVTIVIGCVWALSATAAPVLPGNEPRPLLAQEPIPTLSPPPPVLGTIDKSEKEQRVKPRAARRGRRGGEARSDDARGGKARGGAGRGGEARGGAGRGGAGRGEAGRGEAGRGEAGRGEAGRGKARPAPTAAATPAPTSPPARVAPRRSAPARGEFGFEG